MKELDVITVSKLLVRCNIGITEEERNKKQDVQISLNLYGEFKEAAKTDIIEDTVDYKKVSKSVIAFAESGSFNLVESLAEQISRRVATLPTLFE